MVVTSNDGTVLLISGSGVERAKNIRLRSEHGTTEPNSETLEGVSNDVNINHLEVHLREHLDVTLVASLDLILEITLNTTSEVLVHGGTTGECDVIVKLFAGIDGAGLDDGVDNIREGTGEIRREDLRVEEKLRAEETLITDINSEGSLGLEISTLVLHDVLGGLLIVLGVFLDDVGADVGVHLLHATSEVERLIRGHGLATGAELLHDEVGDGTTGEGDVLDARADYVTGDDGNDVSDTITGVNDSTSDFRGGTAGFAGEHGGTESKHSLDSDVETRDVESLEHDLSSVLSVFGRVEWGFGHEEVVLLRIAAEVLINTTLKILLHVIPVRHNTFSDRIINVIVGTLDSSINTDKEVEILSIIRLANSLTGLSSNVCGNQSTGLEVTRITKLGITKQQKGRQEVRG